MKAYLDAIARIDSIDRAARIADTATAAQGQGKNIDKAIQELLK